MARRAGSNDVDAAAHFDCGDDGSDLVKVTAVRQSSGEVLGERLEAHVVEVDAHADLDPGELQPQAGAAAAAAKIA